MNKFKLFLLITTLTINSSLLFGQADSSEFCGKYFKAPNNCQTIGNMIKCNDYVLTWTYEPNKELRHHKKELLAQISKPKKIKVSVINNDLIGYLSKIDIYHCLIIIGKVNEQGTIINLYLNREIKTTDDLPDCVKQFILIKS